MKSNFIKTFLILCAFVFASCSQIANESENSVQTTSTETGIVQFSIDGLGNSKERTVLPFYSEDAITDIVISYSAPSVLSTQLASYTTYAEFKNAKIAVPVGTYYFEITASSNGGTLRGTSSQTTISASTTTNVSITLSASSYGAIKVSFTNYNAIGATKFKVKLDSSNYSETSFSKQNFFYINNATSGSKLFTATFYNASGTQVGVYTTYVQVLAAALSEETVDLSKMAANILLYEPDVTVPKSSSVAYSFTLSKQTKVKVAMLNTEKDNLYFYLVDKATYDSTSKFKTDAPSGTIDCSEKTNQDWTTTKTLSAGTYYIVAYNANIVTGKTITFTAEEVIE